MTVSVKMGFLNILKENLGVAWGMERSRNLRDLYSLISMVNLMEDFKELIERRKL